MRAVVQRVKKACVKIAGEQTAQIGPGIVVLLGIGREDTLDDARYLAQKCVHLRIFDDEQGVMNKSLEEADGEVLLVSQFTLMADARKGRRPSYMHAMAPEQAREMFEQTVIIFRQEAQRVETGVFQADMDICLVNHGPVTILLDSKKVF